MKSVRVPLELLALSQMQRASTPDAGAPLYLPAFATAILADQGVDDDDVAEADFGDAAEIADEDDDFY